MWDSQATCQPSSSNPLCAARPLSGIFRAPCFHPAQPASPGLAHALACAGLHWGAPGLGDEKDPSGTEACLSPAGCIVVVEASHSGQGNCPCEG